MAEVLERHKKTRELGPREYRMAHRLLLNRTVGERVKIYLDTAYWLRLRDCERGEARSQADKRVRDLLFRAVRERLVAIPATEPLLRETLRQNVPESRQETGRLVDQLSLNLALVGENQRSLWEVDEWFSALTRQPVAPAGALCWSWSAHLSGPLRVETSVSDDELAARLEKAADDMLSDIPFSRIVEDLCADRAVPFPSEQIAAADNRAKAEVWDPDDPFDVVLELECQGYWRSKWPFFLKHGAEILKKAPFIDGNPTSDDLLEHLLRLVTASLREKMMGTFLPGMQIMAGANAAIRTQERRRFKPGDAEDQFHAMAALPYCDVFATDRSFQHLLCTKPLAYDQLFGCRVVASPDELIGLLEEAIDS